MTVQKEPGRFEAKFRLAVSALVLLTAAFSSRTAAQEMRIERVGVSAPVGGGAVAAPAGAALSGAAIVPGGAPSLFAPSTSLGVFAPQALAPSAVAAPAILAAYPAAAGRISLPRAAASSPAPSSVRPDQQSGGRADAGATPHPTRPEALAASAPDSAPRAAAEGPRSAETDRDGAERDFSAFLGERLAEGKGAAALAPSASPRFAETPPASARLSSPARRAGAGLFAAVPVALALGLHPSLQAVLHPSLATWHAISQTGNVVGNVGCAIFPLVQIYETFQGKSTPKARAIIGAAASLGLGLISAPILHNALWGFQNIFGGITLLVPLLIGGLAGRMRGNGLKETALISAAAAVLSAGLYFAVAATLPGLLAAAFSAAAVAKIVLGVQIATSSMFMWMYLPEVIRVLRGRPTDGFSQGFTLVYLISATASMVWALPSAWIIKDAHQLSYRLIFGVNAIYSLTAFISFWFARRRAKNR